MKKDSKVHSSGQPKHFSLEMLHEKLGENVVNDVSETANEIFETAGRLWHAIDESMLDDAAKVYFMDLLTIISDDAGFIYEVTQ